MSARFKARFAIIESMNMSFVSPAPSSARRTANANRLLTRGAAVILGSLLLWASAKVQVPLWPVPMTMQTYVVLTMGALLGWRLGGATVATYLAEGALGLPVFAGTPMNGIGIGYIAGPTGGYLAGYLPAVLLVGVLTTGRRSRSMFATGAALLAGELTILVLGCAWLAVLLGWDKAIALGLGPFLVGDALKLALATLTVTYFDRFVSKEA